jgi:ribosomal subunit interface protein
MNIQITGKHTDIGDSLNSHIRTELETTTHKYFTDPIDLHVTIEKRGHIFFSEITGHICHGVDFVVNSNDTNPYSSFDSAVSRMKSKLSRYKNRIKDRHHHKGQSKEELVQKYIFDGIEKEEQENHPIIIAEMQMKIKTLSVGDAVMELDLGDQPVVIFKNANDHQINVVFRRADGHISWVNPNNMIQSE